MKHKLIMAAILAVMGLSSSAYAEDVLESLSTDGGFKTLLSAIKTAEMEGTFTAAGPITVFAPTDFAFAALPKDKLDALLGDKEKLKKLLAGHVVPNKVTKADVDAGKVKTLAGNDVSLEVGGTVKIDHVPVVGQGIHADNGVIHSLTAVLLPK